MKYRPLTTNLTYYAGLLLLLTLPWRLDDALAWLPAIIAVYMWGVIVLSVGYHRLFSHHAFQANGFWHALFAFSGVAYMFGSPSQWVIIHQAHHDHSDTELDPNRDGWKAMLWKGYRSTESDKWRAKMLMRNHPQMYAFIEHYCTPISIGMLTLMGLLMPDFLLNAFLPGVAFVLFVGGLHTNFSHYRGQPLNLWWMEYLLPVGGDWLHGTHHKRAGLWDMRTRWYHLDIGQWVIRAIRRT